MNNIKMAVLDMAGTTINEHNVVYKTVCEALKKNGIAVDLNTVLKIGAGKEKYQAIKDILKEVQVDALTKAKKIFEDFEKLLDLAYSKLKVTPIEGVEDVLLDLRKRGIIVVLNTGYSKRIANTLLDKLKWKKTIHYDMLITADDVANGRPHPDMIHKAMRAFHIDDPAHVLKAGDSGVDIEEGKNANCGMTVGVLTGAQTLDQLSIHEPDCIMESLAHVDGIL